MMILDRLLTRFRASGSHYQIKLTGLAFITGCLYVANSQKTRF